MVGWGHHEADAGLTNAALDAVGLKPDFDPERGQCVGGAGERRGGPIPMFGDEVPFNDAIPD